MKKVIFCILILLIIVLGSFKITFFNQDFYFNEFEKLDVYDNLNTNKFELTKAWYSTISYLALSKENKITLVLNDENILTQNEQSHMNDVRLLIQKIFSILNMLYILLIAFILINLKEFKKKSSEYFYVAGNTIMITCTLIVILSIINFQTTFNIFHQIFFTGNFAFPATSKLLLLFPERFFFDFAIRILGISFIIGLIMNLFSNKKRIKFLS